MSIKTKAMTLVLMLMLTTTALASPNGGKHKGNPRQLPRMEFGVMHIWLASNMIIWWI